MHSILQQFIKHIQVPSQMSSVTGTITGPPEVSRAIALDATGGSATSYYPVSDFAQTAIAAAVHEVMSLCKSVWASESYAQIDRMLASRWCANSVYPSGWELPAIWDEFAGDYQTRDGWIRLHTNAPKHRAAALSVLGQPASKRDAIPRVATWHGHDLENAVVDANGAAAVMMSCGRWQDHEQGLAVNREPVVAWREHTPSIAGTDILKQAIPSSPLKGVRVLDLTRVLAGPVSTRFLASLGAEVLRIDPPDWNEGGNALEMTLGKRCAGLNLKKQTDKRVLEGLLSKAHVIVHGYRRDALPQLGLDERLRFEINPCLVDVALNAYGWTGPWTGRRGFDSLIQMSSGIADFGMHSANAENPVPLPFQALDHVTGYLMAAAVIHAINQQWTNRRVLSARLSLARQAKLLQDLSLSSTGGTLAEVEQRHFSPIVEQTPWGALRRLKLPYRIEGVHLRFDYPANKLRSAEPRWMSENLGRQGL